MTIRVGDRVRISPDRAADYRQPFRDWIAAGRPISKSAQVRLAGNSVCPPVAAALVAANVPELAHLPMMEAAE